VELGRDEPIQKFLRDCDAILLCADASALAADGLLRRQQEFEQLIESYLGKEPTLTMRRPFALLITKADLLDGESADWQTSLAMTRHTLETHCASSAVFAVSSLEMKSDETDAAFRVAPRNLDEPLAWLAAALQLQDEDRLAALWSK